MDEEAADARTRRPFIGAEMLEEEGAPPPFRRVQRLCRAHPVSPTDTSGASWRKTSMGARAPHNTRRVPHVPAGQSCGTFQVVWLRVLPLGAFQRAGRSTLVTASPLGQPCPDGQGSPATAGGSFCGNPKYPLAEMPGTAVGAQRWPRLTRRPGLSAGLRARPLPERYHRDTCKHQTP